MVSVCTHRGLGYGESGHSRSTGFLICDFSTDLATTSQRSYNLFTLFHIAEVLILVTVEFVHWQMVRVT